MPAPSTRQSATGPSTGAVSTPDQTPSSKQFRGKLVTIIVGSTREAFSIHKDLLVFYSDYFRAAFNGSFTEAAEGKIELLDVDQEVFQNFHAWLYTRKLTEPLSWKLLVHLWVFGDRFQVPLLQNCVMDEIFAKEKRDAELPLCLMKVAYENTVNGSPLRKAAIELLTFYFKIGDDVDGIMTADNRKHFTVEMLQDVIKELDAARKNRVRYGKPPKRDQCFFHVHGKGERC
ncbi:hypothetical protein KCU81_g5959, partial [Aureobasidium melanogenum]|uniref:BTB domain-containing protein n=1 Tax=Aureobasidium melanogenum (strain CBS 110374) TaxID=1043003 RepID=A0A074W5V6_AURM1